MSASAESNELDPLLQERIELAFPDLVGGFEVVERELEFDGRKIADLLAYSQGRALLISVVEGNDESCVLEAMDALAFARSQPEILATAMPPTAVLEEPACVVLVSVSGFSARQLERLCLLQGDELWLLRKRELRTKRGTHTRLEPIDVGDGLYSSSRAVDLPAWALAEPHRSFLARIAPDRLELALDLLGRLRLIDPSCQWSLDGSELVGHLGSLEFCRLAWTDGHLEASFGEDSECLVIRDGEAIDRAVDGVLAAYLGQLSAAQVQPRAARPELPDHGRSEPRQESPRDPEPDLESDLDDDLDEVELRPMAPGPLLTAEEIQAFQE